jgi:hypothetical protein
MFRSRKCASAPKHRILSRWTRSLYLEQLETREMLSASLNFQFPAQGEDMTLSIVGGNVTFSDTNSHQVIVNQPLTDTSAIIAHGADGVVDTLRIDYSGGTFGKPITFNGGAGGTYNLVLQAGAFTNISYKPTGAGARSVTTDTETISFSSLNTAQDSTTAAQWTFDVTGLGNIAAQIRLTDDGNATNGMFTVDSNGTGLFPSATVANPTGSVSVLGGSDGSTFYLEPLDPGLTAPVSILGGAGDDTLIVHNGVTATVSFDGAGGTNAVVNAQALGAGWTPSNVLTRVDRPLLFIPGFGGTGANFSTPSGYQDWLLKRGPDPSQLSLEPAAHDYSDIVQTMQYMGYANGSTFFPVLWDWRLPVAIADGSADGDLENVTVDSLAREGFDSGLGYLEYFIQKAEQSWHTLTGTTQTDVDVVTHSTGGLVARAYLQSEAYLTAAGTTPDVPHVHNLVQVGVPEQGVASTFNFLNDNWNEKAASRVLALAINKAYTLVTQDGMTIAGPDINITPTWLAGQSNPQLAFESAYVSTLHDLLATYNGGPTISDVGGNALLADLNANGGLTGFIGDVDNTTIVYAKERQRRARSLPTAASSRIRASKTSCCRSRASSARCRARARPGTLRSIRRTAATAPCPTTRARLRSPACPTTRT